MENDPKIKAEGDEMPPKKPGEEPEAAGCKRCKETLGDGANYCAKCGAPVGAEMPDEEPEEEPESSKPGALLALGSGTIAAMLGLRPDASEPAIKMALSAVLSEVRYVRKVLGAADLPGVKGKLRAMAEDVREGVKAKADLAKAKASNEKRERIDLLLSLSAAGLPGYTRGELIEDVIGANAAGEPIVTGIKPKPGNPIANAPIGELRSFVSGKLANAPPADRSPYEPSEDRAREQSGTDAAAAKALANDPAIKASVAAGVKLEDAIAAHLRQFPPKTNTTGALR